MRKMKLPSPYVVLLPLLLVLQDTTGLRNVVSFKLVQITDSPDCAAGPDNFAVQVQTRQSTCCRNCNQGDRGWRQLTTVVPDCTSDNLTSSMNGRKVGARLCNYTVPLDPTLDTNTSTQIRLVQLNHRGGFCDCWAAAVHKHHDQNPSLDYRYSNGTLNGRYNSLSSLLQVFNIETRSLLASSPAGTDDQFNGACLLSASVPRVMVYADVNGKSHCPSDTDILTSDTDTLTNGVEIPEVGGICENRPHVKVKFDLQFNGDKLDTFDEGVEFSIRIPSMTEWIPLQFYTSVGDEKKNPVIAVNQTSIGNDTILMRGFNVTYQVGDEHNVKLNMCSGVFDNFMESSCLEFRWLQTVRQKNESNVDTVKLRNVRISLSSSEALPQDILLLEDKFTEGSINGTRWNTRHVSPDCATEGDCFAKFGVDAPTFIPLAETGDAAGLTISSRKMSTVCLSADLPPPRITYTLITANSPDCQRDQHGTFPAPVQLQYQLMKGANWITLENGNESVVYTSNTSTVQVADVSIDLDEKSLKSFTSDDFIQFRFIQPEHRGGFCDCWSVANLRVIHWAYHDLRQIFEETDQCEMRNDIINIYNMSYGNETWPPTVLESANITAEQCQGSASVPRGFTLEHQPGSVRTKCRTGPVDSGHKDSPTTTCGDNELRIELSFNLKFVHNAEKNGCDPIDTFNEGVELSFKSSPEQEGNGEWIPLMYFAKDTNLSDVSGTPSTISLTENTTISGARGRFTLRGYDVPYVIKDGGQFNVSVCRDKNVLQRPIEFRWLQTSLRDSGDLGDVIMLDKIVISILNGTHSANLYQSFNFSLESSISKANNVHLKSDCNTPNREAFYFYNENAAFVNPMYTISSRQIVIGPLDPRNITLKPEVTPATPTDSEREIRNLINGNEDLAKIFNQIADDPEGALSSLDDLLTPKSDKGSTGEDIDLTAATYLLSSIKNQFGGETVEPSVSKIFLSVSDSLVNSSQGSDEAATNSTDDELAGSTLLQVLDNFALNNYNGSEGLPSESTPDNIVIRVHEEFVSTQVFEGGAEIQLPEEILGGDKEQPVRIASFLFRNMSGILPATLGGAGNDSSDSENQLVSRLASPVVSASFQCDNCTTSNLSTAGVKVTFNLSPYDKALMKNDQYSSVKCVFWKFDNVERAGAVLFPGEWSDEGCETTIDPETSRAVCSCNHLTHFAILLSAKPLDISPSHTLALGIIGKVGVAVSLVAMAMTIVVFIFLNRSIKRPLYTMRNYIHIQLCITLGIAQIIFVAGIEPHMDEGKLVGGIPVGCRLVAVLLHYWFLVAFMWMLMEGVVLYVALVRVFAEHHGRYMAAFTIASYGLPLLYVGGLTVPLGFARSEEMRQNQTYDYGYQAACYLNPATSFIWTLIVPVILIFLANIGFFIMAIVILSKHQKGKDTKKKAKQVRNWLKACISLTVVMGLTWILGFLVVERPELIFLAYIFTFCVAFQGLFIFVIFVLVSESKRLREMHTKWWKSTVAESEFLSRHFGNKSFTTTYSLSTQQVQMSQFAVTEKESLAQGQLVNTFEKEEPSNDEDKGTFFEILYVPTTDTKLEMEDTLITTFSSTGEDRKFSLEEIFIPPSVSPQIPSSVSSSSCDETTKDQESDNLTKPSTCASADKSPDVTEPHDKKLPSLVENGGTPSYSNINCVASGLDATEVDCGSHGCAGNGVGCSTSSQLETDVEANVSVKCV